MAQPSTHGVIVGTVRHGCEGLEPTRLAQIGLGGDQLWAKEAVLGAKVAHDGVQMTSGPLSKSSWAIVPPVTGR